MGIGGRCTAAEHFGRVFWVGLSVVEGYWGWRLTGIKWDGIEVEVNLK